MKKLLIIFGVVALLMIFGSPSMAATYSVPIDFGTIQGAIDSASAGDTITVAAGTYNEDITIDVPITLTGENASTTVVNGSGTGTVVSITSDAVVLSGFTVQGSGSNPAADAGIMLTANNCKVSDMIITGNVNGIGLIRNTGNTIVNNDIIGNTYYGVLLIGASGNTVEGNTIESHNLDGIALDNLNVVGGPVGSGSIGNYIKANNISSTGRDGIFIGENCDGNYITDGNIISNIAINGIHVWRPSGQTITGNTIDTALTGIRLLGSSDNTITCNTITRNTTGILAERSWQVGVWYPCDNNTINCNSISGNSTGFDASNNDGVTVTAQNNWWGDVTGPYDSTNNPEGLGDPVSEYVDYFPWSLTPDPCETKTIGFWKNHPESLQAVLGLANEGTIPLGEYPVASVEDAEEVFTSASAKCAEDMLAPQLLAAKLNELHLMHLGYDVCEDVNDAIFEADEELSGYYNGPDDDDCIKGRAKRDMLGIAYYLDMFNNGEICEYGCEWD